MTADQIYVSLEEGLQRASHSLAKKIQASVDILRNAEKLALKYNVGGGYFLAFSAGKDSQALYYIAKMAQVKFEAHMNFTSVDPPQVIRFVRKEYPSVITHKPPTSIFKRAVEREILPTMRVRWCCADFKENAGAGMVTLTGVRHSESVKRSKRKIIEVTGHKFQGDTMSEFAVWQDIQIQKQLKKIKNVNQDQFAEVKESEIRCINGKDSIIINPIIDWSEKDVWEFLNNVIKCPHCELYDKGYSRIGCILCPMSSRKQKIKEMKMFPHVKRGWIEAIKKIRGGGYSKVRIPVMVRKPSLAVGSARNLRDYGRKEPGIIGDPDPRMVPIRAEGYSVGRQWVFG